MSEYNEGDLVEAVKDEQLVRGRIFIPTGAGRQFLGDCGERVGYYEKNGFTITVIEKAKPKVELPIEAGLYADRTGDVWLFDRGGAFVPITNGLGSGRMPDEDVQMFARRAAEYAPFTRLEPRAVTAKDVADWLWENRTEIRGALKSDDIRSLLATLEVEFGVTDA